MKNSWVRSSAALLAALALTLGGCGGGGGGDESPTTPEQPPPSTVSVKAALDSAAAQAVERYRHQSPGGVLGAARRRCPGRAGQQPAQSELRGLLQRRRQEGHHDHRRQLHHCEARPRNQRRTGQMDQLYVPQGSRVVHGGPRTANPCSRRPCKPPRTRNRPTRPCLPPSWSPIRTATTRTRSAPTSRIRTGPPRPARQLLDQWRDLRAGPDASRRDPAQLHQRRRRRPFASIPSSTSPSTPAASRWPLMRARRARWSTSQPATAATTSWRCTAAVASTRSSA